ncbi:TrkH family potassium uptake protein [Bythopirellula polymerisocia]|uniref:Ktr system potassium uptake protein B n=1 Tax=Bythopirellula polymerisocia TaxID=2528003 RepID=A0A5C6CLW6_9BACT|nr:potassium transporter TrkG [Bythopirellula polymerisocia]TWU25903.1 Ktr system potassium uptake protein B [Bythopirellula polymerisocia]
MKSKITAIGETISHWHPLRLLVLGYASYLLVTWLLLCLPFSWAAAPVSPLDNLFIATSAVSTTGLATVNPPEAYSFLGELIVLLAVQVGGLGYMTLGSFVILSRKSDLPKVRASVGLVAFSLPSGFDLRLFIRHVVTFTVLIEVAGAALLYYAFRSAGIESPLWPSIFHSISAFCTAGFSVFPDSLEQFQGNVWVNMIISVLSLLGAIGFLVASDFWLTLTQYRTRLTLTTKIIVLMTFWSIMLGWLLLFLVEPTMQSLPLPERLMTSGFQSMSALTTVGFNTHSIGSLHMASVLIVIVLMVVGASPSGTGGGLKSTSVSAAFAVVWSVLRGRDRITFWGTEVPDFRLHAAFAATFFYLVIFLTGSTLLMLVQASSFGDILFEAASAIGTVGLSRGITSDLTPVAKLIVIALMFIGRVGPLTFGLAFFTHGPMEKGETPEDLAV